MVSAINEKKKKKIRVLWQKYWEPGSVRQNALSEEQKFKLRTEGGKGSGV